MTAPTAPAARRRPQLRRRAIARVGLMAALLVVAGALPWVTGGPLGVRLVALPLLAAGLFLGAAALRLHRTLPPMPEAGSTSAVTRPAACAGCACGASADGSATPCGAAAFKAPTADTP